MAISLPQSYENYLEDSQALPEVEDLLDHLSTDLPPLNIWLQLGVKYYKEGKHTAFERILKAGSGDDLEKMPQYRSSKEERISMLNRLVAYYFGKALLCAESAQREELFNLAGAIKGSADSKDVNEFQNWIYRGYLLIAKGQMENGVYYFNNTITADPDNVLALLGRACILYHRESYSEALQQYAKAIRINPRIPPNVRLGLAVCHYKLGNKELAYKAFKRVLGLEPNNAEALMGIAILEYEKGNYKEYIDLVVKAYKADRNNSAANMHLARHYFYKKDYERSIKMAEFCLSHIAEVEKQIQDILKLKAECYYILAICHHAQNNMENAFRQYNQAVKFNPNMYLAQYGLGQMYIYQNDIDKAITCFENVLKIVPNNYESLRILGSLLAKQHKKDAALEKLNAVVRMNPNDCEAWIEIAQLLEISKPKQALEAYERALAGIKDPPQELLNNIAILRHKTSDQANAEIAYGKITDKKKTLIYNKARWHEDNDRLEEAKVLYQELLSEQNHYPDAYIRLGMISRKLKDYVKALEYARSAISADKKPINALCLKGSLEAELGEYKKALETFNKVIMDYSHHDLYALLAMGNQYYELAVHNRSEHSDKNLSRALQFYLKVLSLDEHNAYAAIGAAIILAEHGDYSQAHETFKQVFDAYPGLDFILVNQAHLQFLQGKYEAAAKIYAKAWDKKALEPDILAVYWANALSACGKYKECIDVFKSLPQTFVNVYNTALALSEHAFWIFKKDRRSVRETETAIANLQEAIEAYDLITNTKWELRSGNEARTEDKKILETIAKKIVEKVEMAKVQLAQSEKTLEYDKAIEQKEAEERERAKEQLKELLGKKRSPEPSEDVPTKIQKTEES
ncbi:unnamed protein product [Blepharisma stoltei]|uniref:UDP-N-acetylglucosamine--peptide N-acetylglucosaminyltransferase SPINDLY n=1 Tax=Blepharisma stoltei TaxID=1481888 RepID=A0AAU9J9T6_9CILI|nr:unnamed protein product [Blepharisma stoltei]